MREETPLPAPPPPGAPLRMLLVDADPGVAEFARREFPAAEFRVSVATTAEEAAQQLACEEADLVVADASGGSSGGAALCEWIRSQPGARDAVVLVMTRAGDPEELRGLLDAGASDWLPRPVPPELFRLRVEAAARRARARSGRRRAMVVRDVLLEISHAMAASADLPTFLAVVRRQLSRLVDTTNFTVALHDPATGHYSFPYSVDEVDDVATFTDEQLAKSCTEWVRRNGRPLVLDEESTRRMTASGEVVPVGAPSASWMGVPLATPAGVIGVAAIQSYAPGSSYSDDDLALMRVIADDLAMAIARKRAEDALRESEERYARALAASSDGLWDWDLSTDRVHYSPRWKEAIGYRESQVGSDPGEWLDRLHPDDRPLVLAALDRHLAGTDPLFSCEYRLAHRNGSWRYVTCRALATPGPDGRPRRLVGSQTDVTDRLLTDPLTGLPNRTLFLDRLAGAVERARRHPGAPLGLALLDLDRLQAVNHALGRAGGDRLLVAVADRLREAAGPGRTLARLGSDEFVVLAEDPSSPDEVEALADRIHLALAEPIVVDGRELFATASLGLVLDAEGRSAEELLGDAAIAVGKAKQKGRGETEVFASAMRARALARMALEEDLRRALERDELVSAYQPLVDLATGRVAGFEALVRWNRPGHGPVPPPDFVPVAAEMGLAAALSAGMLRRALAALAATGAGAATVSVNLTPPELLGAGLVEALRRTLEDAGLAPSRLKLEITEGALLDDSERVMATLRDIRALGCGLVIDDFGTGYSSLSYLPRLPIDALKIDQSFVRGMEDEREKFEVVRTIVALAKNLGLAVVAEGVETAEQARQLRELGCDYGQGWLFSKAVDAAQMGTLLGTTFA